MTGRARLRRRLRALSRVLLPALLLLAPATAQESASRNDEPFDIYMVVWRGETDVERGFQAYLRERGIRANVTIRDLARDRSRIPEVVAEIHDRRPDLVHTWGTSTGLGIFGPRADAEPGRHVDEAIPGLFSLVAYPVEAGLVSSLEDPGRALSGTAYLPPLRSQLDAILAYTPVQRFGMLYNSLESNSRINVGQMKAAAEELGLGLVQLEVPQDADGKPDAAALPGLVDELARQGVDFLYIGPDSFLSINSEAVTERALEHGIPSYAGTEFGFNQSRALLGLVSRYYLVGKLAGLQAERVLLDGQALAEMPVVSLSRFTLLVRMPVAHRLQRYPPMSLLPLAEIVVE